MSDPRIRQLLLADAEYWPDPFVDIDRAVARGTRRLCRRIISGFVLAAVSVFIVGGAAFALHALAHPTAPAATASVTASSAPLDAAPVLPPASASPAR